MAITGVRVTHPDGTVRDYTAGRSFQFDGHADLQILGDDEQMVALRKRDSVQEVEVVTPDTPPAS